jgi:hypothetical protein
MRQRTFHFGWATAIGLILMLSAPCRADGPTREQQVKAAFIYNFTQFVDWPPEAFDKDDSPLIVAMLGDDSLAGALDKAMDKKTAGSRPIVVKHFATLDDLGPCHLLFVPATQDSNLSALFDKIKGKPILAVGESDAFMPAGGTMHLFLEDGKMKFEVNSDVCDAIKLHPSAKLMSLARIFKKS